MNSGDTQRARERAFGAKMSYVPGVRSPEEEQAMLERSLTNGAAGASDDLHKAFRDMMVKDEGNVPYVYRDPLKPWILTAGIGHKVLPKDHLKLGEKVGDQWIRQTFENDADWALKAAQDQAREAGISDPAFIARLGSVNFQLGGSFSKAFPTTWALIKAGDYEAAAQEAQKSKWYRQTPSRVIRFQKALRALPPKMPSQE